MEYNVADGTGIDRQQSTFVVILTKKVNIFEIIFKCFQSMGTSSVQ